MKCVRCHNEDPIYFYKDKDVYYCRKCIGFGRIDINETLHPPLLSKITKKVQYTLPYSLTKYQKQIANEIINHLEGKRNVLVYAATGAGKTEITMPIIEKYINAGKKVAIAISRRQVVLEICKRMKQAFLTLHVIAVCEGYTHEVDGDLIVCTMHQLHRYYKCFDLLIMDEVDAFPYVGNTVLSAIAKHSSIGEIVYLTATPDEMMKKEVEEGKLSMVTLFKRPHGYPLIVPKCYCFPEILQIAFLLGMLIKYKKQNRQVLIFVSTIKKSILFEKLFSLFFRCDVVTSKSLNKDEIIHKFRLKQLDFLFSTTILERGITIPNVDVVVLDANHIVFNEASLIQISGRVGRSFKSPKGRCFFLCTHKNENIKNCIQTIKMMNEECL